MTCSFADANDEGTMMTTSQQQQLPYNIWLRQQMAGSTGRAVPSHIDLCKSRIISVNCESMTWIWTIEKSDDQKLSKLWNFQWNDDIMLESAKMWHSRTFMTTWLQVFPDGLGLRVQAATNDTNLNIGLQWTRHLFNSNLFHFNFCICSQCCKKAS